MSDPASLAMAARRTRRNFLMPMRFTIGRMNGAKYGSASAVSMISGLVISISSPPQRTPPPPAARRLRHQSVPSLHGRGRTKPSGVGRIAIGVEYGLPERRPRCRTTPQIGVHPVSAARRASGAGSAEDQLREHFRGLRRLSRDEPELFTVIAELAIRGVRDASLRKIVGGTDDAWRAMLRTLLRRAKDEGAVATTLDPDGMAAVIVATLKGTFMLPSSEPENVERTFRQLETLVGLRAKRSSASRGRAKR